MRVVMTALAICALSFLTGVAGDLSAPRLAEAAAPRAVIALPPHLENAVRAGPLATSAAEAAPARPRVRERAAQIREVAVEPQEKPRTDAPKRAPKGDPARAPKAERVKG